MGGVSDTVTWRLYILCILLYIILCIYIYMGRTQMRMVVVAEAVSNL